MSVIKKKILMLNYEFPPIGGGAGNAHLYLLKEYAKRDDLKIDVLTSAPKGGFVTEKFSENITIYKIGLHKKNLHYWRKLEVLEWLFKAYFRYHKLVRENDYQLIHAFFGFPSGWLCYKTAGKLPYIISLRGSDVPGYNVRLGLDYKILAGLFRRIWKNATGIIANSEGLRKLALEFMPEEKIDIIPNGIDTERFCPHGEKKVNKPVRLLTVCRLISRKRIDLLIKAVTELKKNGVDTELNIAGEGNLMNQLKQLAVESNVTERVSFSGRIPPERMPEVYRNSDVFIMASAHEGMSNAMLEAMASGLPIVTTRCEGVEELIKDNGIIVDNAQPESIAEAIEKLTGDQNQYKSMSKASRKQAENFSWQSTAEKYIDLYSQVEQKC